MSYFYQIARADVDKLYSKGNGFPWPKTIGSTSMSYLRKNYENHDALIVRDFTKIYAFMLKEEIFIGIMVDFKRPEDEVQYILSEPFVPSFILQYDWVDSKWVEGKVIYLPTGSIRASLEE